MASAVRSRVSARQILSRQMWNTIGCGKEASEGWYLSCNTYDSLSLTGLSTLVYFKSALLVGATAIRTVNLAFARKPSLFYTYRLVSHSRRVLQADRRVEMPKGCVTSSLKSFG